MAAVDYETGIASSPSDLVSKLATFAAANGWTISPGTTGSVFIKGDIVVGMIGNASDVSLRGALAYNGAAAWNAQTNNAGQSTTCDTGAGPFTAYHFFAGAEATKEYLHVAVEVSAGHFRHFSLGSLIKQGTYTGGTYVDSTNWANSTTNQNIPDSGSHQVICDANADTGNGQVWCDYDAKTNNWQIIRTASQTTTTLGTGNVRDQGISQMFMSLGYQRWNLRQLLAPLQYFVNRASSLKSPIGRIPDMRMVGMQNLVAGDEVTVGSDTWLVFPMIQRTDSWGSGNSAIESSGHYGYAYLLPP